MLETLKAIDLRILMEVAGQSLNAADFQLGDWSVTPVKHEKSIETTGGLFRFQGSGWDGRESRHWSAVLKIVIQPDEECTQPGELCYWRREMLAYQTGLLAGLPGAVRAPRCFGVSEHESDGAKSGWIWLENIQESGTQVWGLDEYQLAARQFGRFGGAYLTGRQIPTAAWLCGSIFRGLYNKSDWWAKYTNPASPKNAWQLPIVHSVFSDHLQKRVLRVWADHERFLTANESLPQVFCHNDLHRRNLMQCVDRRGQPELVAIDWGFCGPGRLGNDLGELIGTSLSYFALDPDSAAETERAVIDGYLAGLKEAGWGGDARLVRLGYLISMALYYGGTLVCEVAMAQPGAGNVNIEAKYGSPLDQLLPGWTRLAEFSLERAEEARFMIDSMA